MTASNAPPPGFEDLAQAQTTLVDVYVGGRFTISTMALYDLQTVEFLAPAEIVAALSDLADPAAVERALSLPLATNAQALCAHRAQVDCGEVTPDIAAIIFDEATFRVALFVAPDQWIAKPVNTSRFLPAPTARELGSVHQFNVAMAGGGAEDSVFDLGATSLVARGERRLYGRYDITRSGFTISELAVAQDRKGYRYEAGLYRSLGRSVAFVGEQDVVGVRAGTALDLRADLDTAEGTPIYLFLQRRSRVDVFRGERLIDSRFYEAGNQQLNTSRFPDGAYDLRVRVRGDDGREREERFFFVRTRDLPPLDQPLIYAEAGALTSVANAAAATLSSGGWLRTGAAKRLNNEVGAEVELLHAASTTMLQGGVFSFGAALRLRGNLMATSDGDRGLWLQGSWQRDLLSASFDLRHVAVGDGARVEGVDLFSESYTQSSFTLNAPLGGGRMTVRAQLDRRASANNSSGFGASFTRPVFRRGDVTLDLDADIAATANDTLMRVGVQARWRKGRRLTTVRPQLQVNANADGTQARALLDARSSLQWEHDEFGQMTHTAFALREDNRSVLGTALATDSARGRANADMQYVSAPDDQFLSYSANARFGVTTHEGAVALGGRYSDAAAVVIDIEGAAETGQFDVLVDDQSVAQARTGERTVVALAPYRSYEVRIATRGANLANVNESAQTITLYPGNVHTLNYAPQVITVIVGQALWPDGAPVANARLANAAQYGATDDNGWFQVEVTSLKMLEFEQIGRGVCRLDLTTAAVENGLAVLPPISCTAIAATP